MMMVDPVLMSREELLECDLWLLAMCWKAGWNVRWEAVDRWVEQA